jgi:DNA-binding transcriptional LysR family regulator
MEYMLRVDDIHAFVAVAEAGTLVAAAQRLGVSQPTLSKAMGRLERGIGAQLMERGARGVALTEIGELFLRHVRGIDLGLKDALEAVRDMRRGLAGSVRIGVGMGVPQSLVVAACQPVLRGASVSLEIHGGMSDSLFRAVASGETDFAVTGVRPPGSEALAWVPLFRDPMIAIAPASHRLVGARRITWEALAEETWLVANVGTITRAWFDQQFADRGLVGPKCVVGLRSYPVALELGEALAAISLVPASTMRPPQQLKNHRTLRTPSDWVSERMVGILHRRRGYLSPVARRLMEAFESEAKKSWR